MALFLLKAVKMSNIEFLPLFEFGEKRKKIIIIILSQCQVHVNILKYFYHQGIVYMKVPFMLVDVYYLLNNKSMNAQLCT